MVCAREEKGGYRETSAVLSEGQCRAPLAVQGRGWRSSKEARVLELREGGWRARTEAQELESGAEVPAEPGGLGGQGAGTDSVD